MKPYNPDRPAAFFRQVDRWRDECDGPYRPFPTTDEIMKEFGISYHADRRPDWPERFIDKLIEAVDPVALDRGVQLSPFNRNSNYAWNFPDQPTGSCQ